MTDPNDLDAVDGMTVDEHYSDIRALADELAAQHAMLVDQLEDYRQTAEDLMRATEQAAEEHAGEFDDLMSEAAMLLSDIERIDLGSVPFVKTADAAREYVRDPRRDVDDGSKEDEPT